MNRSLRIYYEVDKAAGYAYDNEGNNSEMYMCLKFTLKEPMSREEKAQYIESHKEKLINAAAGFLKTDPGNVKITTRKQYNKGTEGKEKRWRNFSKSMINTQH